jgi:class 3 adenylate cyclase/tetratricopeptide (TPR) repeat protein
VENGQTHSSEGGRVCPMCGEVSAESFRFCGHCGTAFPDTRSSTEVRKAVTIVFCDLVGSTSLGEAVDSEALREIMSTYLEEMRQGIEEHGGTVEKFLGDGVLAVFGVPRVHEDDALRAVRAGVAMKHRLGALNRELEERWGVRLANRTGVNTGELVAGEAVAGHGLVIGDPVNVAARLEQAAPTNEILIGERTFELVRDHVEVDEVEPLALKGKSEPVQAYRLLTVDEGEAMARHHHLPMIGRQEELALLRSAFEYARQGQARLATVVGHAGMGKSRLTEEFAQSIAADARVLRGRCLPYGRGITFWPLVEIIREAASIEESDPPAVGLAKLTDIAGDPAVSGRVAPIASLGGAEFSLEEIRWGTRKLFEVLARERPLVVVFDDIHWAEPTLVDLIRDVADSAAAPVLVMCLARHDLLELHPDWPQGADAPLISLEPLSEEDMAPIVENILGGGELGAEVRDRILEAAAGNPLFVEQMVTMLVDEGTLRLEDGCWRPTIPLSEITVPPTIQALLTARVEQLERDERAVIEPSSVAGFRFAQHAISSLVDEPLSSHVGAHLGSLTTKQLVRPDLEGPFGDDGYRFEHVLIRDATYERLLKRTRATLHERFVEWADRLNRERGREAEFQEILGYHLEQAHRYLSELGPLDDHGRELGVRAATRLRAAGRRAFARGDMPAAAGLLQRAAELMPVGAAARLELLPELGEALVDTGEFLAAAAFLKEAIEGADAIGDAPLRAHAQVVAWLLDGQVADPGSWAERAVAGAAEVIPVFEQAGDDVGLAAAYRLLAWAHGTACRFGEVAAAAERAALHARRAGDERQRRWARAQYAMAVVWGPTPVPEAIARCEEILEQTAGDRRTEGLVRSLLGRLEAMRGDFSRARALAREARATLEDMGKSVVTASTSLDSCGVEMLGGDPAAAERDLRRDYEALEEMSERYLLSTVAAELANVLVERGDDGEAERYTKVAEELAADDDLTSQALWRWVRARVLARRGETEAAVALARDATNLLSATDSPVAQADAVLALSEVVGTAGNAAEAHATAEAALRLYERKGDLVSATKARKYIGWLSDAPDGPDRDRREMHAAAQPRHT